MGRKLVFCASTALIALLSGAQAATAQEASTRGGASATVEEVVITATKRDTKLQDTPIAITAIGSQTLERAHVNTIADATHLVPNFQATTQGDHGVITMTLRGVGNDSAKTEYADPEVALFIDGVYAPRAEGAAALLFDLDNIQVLRGPQGTLWGRNSTVGAVNMVTAKPVLGDTFGNIELGGGNYNAWRARGAVNVPVTDTFALRLAFAHEQHDGYVDFQNAASQLPSLASQQAAYNAAVAAGTVPASTPFQAINPNLFVQGGQKYSSQDQSAIRLSALWAPTDKLRANLSYEYFLDKGTPSANLMQNPRPGQSFWSTLADTAPYLHREVHTFRARVDYDINDYLGVSYIGGYSRYSGSSDFDQDGGANVPTSFTTGATYQDDRTNYSHYSYWSDEIELRSRGHHTVDWIVGFYYGGEDNSIRFDIPIMNGTQQGTVSWQGSFIQPKETVDTKALFGQAVWNITDRFRLTGGLRYTWDQRKNVGGTNNAWSYNAACPQVPLDAGTNPLSPAVNPSCYNTYQHNDGKYSDDKPTWLVRADADITPNFLIYGSVSTGYKSGGLQDGGVPYGPETLYNYEIGTKNTFLGGRLTWNNAAFYEDFKDFQFSAPVIFVDGNHGLATTNAEGATIYGFESELAAKPTPDDTLQLTLSLLHTKLGKLYAGSNDYANLVCDPSQAAFGCVMNVTGNDLPHSPTFAAQVVYAHDFHIANGALLTPRVSFHYETKSWLSVFNLGSGDQQEGYTRTDLSLIYRSPGDKPWEVEGYVQNVEDARIRTNAGATATNIYTSQYMAPRTYGVNFRYKF